MISYAHLRPLAEPPDAPRGWNASGAAVASLTWILEGARRATTQQLQQLRDEGYEAGRAELRALALGTKNEHLGPCRAQGCIWLPRSQYRFIVPCPISCEESASSTVSLIEMCLKVDEDPGPA